jgi:hypothetical protein
VNKRIYFFPDGNTAVTDGASQCPELQESWVLLFARFLESKGEDPTAFELHFPDGSTGRIFRTDEGLNWQLLG